MNIFILFIIFSGFIIGLGAVTVIDLHGFLGRKSSYWTVATTRTHKITKPLIWFGTFTHFIGLNMLYAQINYSGLYLGQLLIFIILVINGLFLSFGVSPMLIAKEKAGKDTELLSNKWQVAITISFIISFVGWWTNLLLTLITLGTFCQNSMCY